LRREAWAGRHAKREGKQTYIPVPPRYQLTQRGAQLHPPPAHHRSDFDYLPELANNPMADRILQCLGDGSQEEGEAAAKEASNRKQKPDEVDFATFVRALDCFSPYATPKRKLDLMYRLYDFDGDGLISREDMTIAMDRVIGLGATKWPPPACQGAGGHLPPPPCACACDSRRFPILDGHLDRSSRLLSL